MRGSVSGSIAKSKRQNIPATHFSECIAKLFNNRNLFLVSREASQPCSKRIGAVLAEESIHMRFDELIVQTHTDSVVVEEENTVTTPVLKNSVNEL